MELLLGRDQYFGADQLVSARVKTSVDPLFGYLQTDSMELTLLTETDLQPAVAVQKQAVLTHKGKTVATQQIQNCVREGGCQKILCKTDLDFLRLEYMGDIFQGETAVGIFLQLLGDRRVDVEIGYLGTISGHIPICTRGQAVRMLTQAVGACMRVNPEGEFLLVRLAETDPAVIPANRVLGPMEMTYLPEYSRVELVSHTYTKGQNIVNLFSGREFSYQEQTIKFQEPVHWINLSQGDVRAQGVNFITFMPTEPDVLDVKPYLHGTSYLSRDLLELKEHTRVLSVRENTLICPENSQQLFQQLCQRAQMRQQLKVKILVESENVGDFVSLQTPWGTTCTGHITAMDSTYTPYSHVATITVTGKDA